MNKVHRVVWNAVTQSWVAAPEVAKSRRKGMALKSVAVATALLSASFVTSTYAASLVDTEITTTADFANAGISASGGMHTDATGVSVSTQGEGAHAAKATGQGSLLEIDGGSFVTVGKAADALVASDGASIVLGVDSRNQQGAAITTTGTSARSRRSTEWTNNRSYSATASRSGGFSSAPRSGKSSSQ